MPTSGDPFNMNRVFNTFDLASRSNEPCSERLRFQGIRRRQKELGKDGKESVRC